jgi:hypothetical protein
LNGKFGLWQKLKFLYYRKFIPCKKAVGIVFGIVPEWQGKGVDAYLITEAHQMLHQVSVPYEDYEMLWIGDFNPKMLNVGKSLGEDVIHTRVLCTYRYIFDRTAPFKRHPILN